MGAARNLQARYASRHTQERPTAGSLFVSLPDVGDETPSLVVVHCCHETTGKINKVLFYLIFL